MTPRQTSLDAFNAILHSGALSRVRWEVYALLYTDGPCTASQVDRRLVAPGKRPHHSKRLTELEALDLVRRVGEIACPITGHLATAWDVTDRLPKSTTPRTVDGCALCHPAGRMVERNPHWRIVRDEHDGGDFRVAPTTHARAFLAVPEIERGALLRAGVPKAIERLQRAWPDARVRAEFATETDGEDHFSVRVFRGTREEG